MSLNGKKVMLLGGNYFQMTATKAAKELGCHVISVDYLPDNPGHKYADEYYNVSTTDKEAVLELAKKLKIDGIVSYASDVSAPTAAYVAEKMGLPTNPYDTIEIMTRKDLFHAFLKEKGFYIPEIRNAKSKDEIHAFYDEIKKPFMIKPVSASGSKGVSKIENREQIEEAYAEVKKYMSSDIFVLEEFVQRDYYQIAGDAFVKDGKIIYFGLANEHFDNSINPLVPIGESFPADISQEKHMKALLEIERALNVLGYMNGAVNLDFMFDTEGNVFIIELGPRNGGNLISDAILEASGTNLAEWTIKNALGEKIDTVGRPIKKFISSYIYHSDKTGIYQGIDIDKKLKHSIVRSDMFVEAGFQIKRFENGGCGIGAAILQFESKEEMLYIMDHMNEHIEIKVKEKDE